MCGDAPEGEALINTCLNQFNAAYAAFRQAAHDDVQSSGFWSSDFWLRWLPWLALLVIAVLLLRRRLRRTMTMAGSTVTPPEGSA